MADFSHWLGDQIQEHGLLKVLTAPVLPALGLLGAGIGWSSGALVALGAALLLSEMVLMCVVVGQQNRRMRRLLSDRTKTLRDYAKILRSTNLSKHHVTLWEETITIDKHGDASVIRRVHFRVTEGVVHWIEGGMTQYRPEHTSGRERRKVKNQACIYDAATAAQGPRCDRTWEWTTEPGSTRLGLQVYLPSPMHVGDAGALEMAFDWPRYSRDLLQGGKESYDWKFVPQVDRLDVKVEFTAGALKQAGSQPKVIPVGAVQPPTRSEAAGSVVLAASYTNVPTETRVGFIVDLG